MTISLRRFETIKQVRDHLEPWLRAGDMQDHLTCMAGDPGANTHHAPHDRLGFTAHEFDQRAEYLWLPSVPIFRGHEGRPVYQDRKPWPSRQSEPGRHD